MSSIKTNINLNKFLKNFSAKKLYIKKLKNKLVLLKNLKQVNYKKLNKELFNFTVGCKVIDRTVMYVMDITFSRSNIFLHIADSAGKLIFFISAGGLNYKGKNKRSYFKIFKNMFRILITKFRFLRGKPTALHLKNVGSNKSWVVRKLKLKFFIKTIKTFNLFPFNGCRVKKIRRKKNKRIKKK